MVGPAKPFDSIQSFLYLVQILILKVKSFMVVIGSKLVGRVAAGMFIEGTSFAALAANRIIVMDIAIVLEAAEVMANTGSSNLVGMSTQAVDLVKFD